MQAPAALITIYANLCNHVDQPPFLYRRLRAGQIDSPAAARARRIQVAGSGTGVRLAPDAVGPPGMASIVTVQPAPMVSVFCAMEAAINSVPAGPLTFVLPVPLIARAFFTPL